MKIDLDHIDATIQLFSPATDVAAIKPKPLPVYIRRILSKVENCTHWKLTMNGARGSVIVAAAQRTSEISLPVAISVFPKDVYRPPET